MKTWLVDHDAARAEFDAAIESGLTEFSDLSACHTRDLRIGVANEQGAVYRVIVASNAQEWVAATALMMSLGLKDEGPAGPDPDYRAIFKPRPLAAQRHQ